MKSNSIIASKYKTMVGGNNDNAHRDWKGLLAINEELRNPKR